MSSIPKVRFFFDNSRFSLKRRTQLKSFIKSIFKKEGRRLSSLNFIFCSDETLLQINKQYLQHDYYTDIITFELSVGEPIDAEIYISVDRVRENAEEMGFSFKSELHRVIFHGVLHLCGYGDKKIEQEKKIRKMEDVYINQYFS